MPRDLEPAAIEDKGLAKRKAKSRWRGTLDIFCGAPPINYPWKEKCTTARTTVKEMFRHKIKVDSCIVWWDSTEGV